MWTVHFSLGRPPTSNTSIRVCSSSPTKLVSMRQKDVIDNVLILTRRLVEMLIGVFGQVGTAVQLFDDPCCRNRSRESFHYVEDWICQRMRISEVLRGYHAQLLLVVCEIVLLLVVVVVQDLGPYEISIVSDLLDVDFLLAQVDTPKPP